MAWFEVGDAVRVTMPHAKNKRGLMGVHVMYTTSPEAKFDGAVGTITEVDPDGPQGAPQYLVDFRGHDNKAAIPWMVQWFREEWIQHVENPPVAARDASRRIETT